MNLAGLQGKITQLGEEVQDARGIIGYPGDFTIVITDNEGNERGHWGQIVGEYSPKHSPFQDSADDLLEVLSAVTNDHYTIDNGIVTFAHQVTPQRKKSTTQKSEDNNKSSVHDYLTNLLIKLIEEKPLFWRVPWKTPRFGAPYNYVSGRTYTGINFFFLKFVAPILYDEAGYSSILNAYMTMKQISEKNGKLRKGSKAMPVYYYNRLYFQIINGKRKKITKERYEELLEENHKRDDLAITPYLKYYNVFNAVDISGINFKTDDIEKNDNEKLDDCELIVEAYEDKPSIIEHSFGEANYNSKKDEIRLPEIGYFQTPYEYYSTLFHEFGHSTGHESRLQRKLNNAFKTSDYAYEELIAELTALFLNSDAGIEYYTLNNSAAYIQNWNKRVGQLLRKDNKAIFKAAAEAQKARDYILGDSLEHFSGERVEEGTPETPELSLKYREYEYEGVIVFTENPETGWEEYTINMVKSPAPDFAGWSEALEMAGSKHDPFQPTVKDIEDIVREISGENYKRKGEHVKFNVSETAKPDYQKGTIRVIRDTERILVKMDAWNYVTRDLLKKYKFKEKIKGTQGFWQPRNKNSEKRLLSFLHDVGANFEGVNIDFDYTPNGRIQVEVKTYSYNVYQNPSSVPKGKTLPAPKPPSTSDSISGITSLPDKIGNFVDLTWFLQIFRLNGISFNPDIPILTTQYRNRPFNPEITEKLESLRLAALVFCEENLCDIHETAMRVISPQKWKKTNPDYKPRAAELAQENVALKRQLRSVGITGWNNDDSTAKLFQLLKAKLKENK